MSAGVASVADVSLLWVVLLPSLLQNVLRLLSRVAEVSAASDDASVADASVAAISADAASVMKL